MIGPAAGENSLPGGLPQKLTVKHGGRIQLIPPSRSTTWKSESSFVKLHTAQGMATGSYTCKQLEGLLDPRKFIRVHKSYLVNVGRNRVPGAAFSRRLPHLPARTAPSCGSAQLPGINWISSSTSFG
jgi:hypothetical protein